MKKTMHKPKKETPPKDINGENTYEELEKGVPLPPKKPTVDEITDAAFKMLLQIEKKKH